MSRRNWMLPVAAFAAIGGTLTLVRDEPSFVPPSCSAAVRIPTELVGWFHIRSSIDTSNIEFSSDGWFRWMILGFDYGRLNSGCLVGDGDAFSLKPLNGTNPGLPFDAREVRVERVG